MNEYPQIKEYPKNTILHIIISNFSSLIVLRFPKENINDDRHPITNVAIIVYVSTKFILLIL